MKYELRENFPLERDEFDERIGYAERYLYSLGLGDIAEEIGRINATLFLAKIHAIQEEVGYKRQAMVIGAPDFTFQTDSTKFRDSVPEGAKIIWGDGTYDFVPLEMGFDFCGMLVGCISDDFSIENMLDTLHKMKKEGNYQVDGTKIELENFSPGNHFLEIYEVENHAALNLSKRVAILHTSSNEMRESLRKFVSGRVEEIHTPFGMSYVIQGDDAREYRDSCKYASSFAKRKRELLFKEIFRNDEIITNQNHYELIGPNEGIIGCNAINENGENSVISLNDNAYLIKTRKNLSPEKIKEITPRINDEWVYNNLLNANIVPHGGGHKLDGADSIEDVILYPDTKIFILKCGSHTKMYIDMKNALRSYRLEGILERAQSLELANHYATLRSVYCVKAF